MDFDELGKWYDGYQIGDEMSMFNPNSVIQATDTGRCRSFSAATGSFDAVTSYIAMNFDGLKDGGGRAKVNPTKFQNDLSIVRSKDDVLTVLIHLGYLSFDWRRSECYVPNKEVGDELVNAVEDYYARNDYHIHREYPAGEGYADLVLIPRKNVSSPAIVIELKYDKSTEAAISQIKARNYPKTVADYTGDILLVGINYDKKTKQHECQIERWTI